MNSILQQVWLLDSFSYFFLVVYDSGSQRSYPPRNGWWRFIQSTISSEGIFLYKTNINLLQILAAIQSVFANLAGSELEAYTPDEFWNIFQLNERIVNVHEQQDAYEFYNKVVDLIDEGMEVWCFEN